jgi:hypothetical protein
MCRSPIRLVPKNTPVEEEQVNVIDILQLLARHGPSPQGQMMARLSLGQLLVGLVRTPPPRLLPRPSCMQVLLGIGPYPPPPPHTHTHTRTLLRARLFSQGSLFAHVWIFFHSHTFTRAWLQAGAQEEEQEQVRGVVEGGGGGGGPPVVLALGQGAHDDAMQSQRRLLYELGNMMISRVQQHGGPPPPQPDGPWA